MYICYTRGLHAHSSLSEAFNLLLYAYCFLHVISDKEWKQIPEHTFEARL